MSNNQTNQNINIYPKSCNYGCNTQIYWNNSVNEYWEVFTQKKHICPNRSNKSVPANNTSPASVGTATISTKPTYYSKKPWSTTTPKPKMSNSFELLTGLIETVQQRYEVLSDIVTEYNGKVHGSQRDRDPKTGLIDLLVYYEVPLAQREVKRKFENFVRNNIVMQKRNY